MDANHEARWAAINEAAAASGETSVYLTIDCMVPVLKYLRQWGLAEQGEWGWIAFKTSPTLPVEVEIDFQRRFDAEIGAEFELYASKPVKGAREGVLEAQQRFKIRWIIEPELVGASEAEVAWRYREMLDGGLVTFGMAHPACVMVDQACVQSILEADIPRQGGLHQQRTIAFVRAIGAYLGEGEDASVHDGERSSFNVELRALVNEFFTTVAGGERDVGTVGAIVKEGQVWSSGEGQYGVFTPSGLGIVNTRRGVRINLD